MDIYNLSRYFFNWCFENPEKVNPNFIALYFFCIEHCNRLGWKEKFGLPTTMAKEAIGIKSYNTYKKTLDDLVKFGFIEMIELSKNQYSSNIIALSKKEKALDKALDKALMKHTSKQSESTHQSIDSIDIQLYNSTNKQDYYLVNGKIIKENLVDWYLKNQRTIFEALLMQNSISIHENRVIDFLREKFINGSSFNDYKHISNSFARAIKDFAENNTPRKVKLVR